METSLSPAMTRLCNPKMKINIFEIIVNTFAVIFDSCIYSSVQSLSHVQLFAHLPVNKHLSDAKVPSWDSQVAQWERICLPMQETWVQPLGQEDPLEKEMATHSNPLGNLMGRGAWQATVHVVAKRAGHDLATQQQQSIKLGAREKAKHRTSPCSPGSHL